MKKLATLIIVTILAITTLCGTACSSSGQTQANNTSNSSVSSSNSSEIGDFHKKFGDEAADCLKQYMDGEITATAASVQLQSDYELVKHESSNSVNDTAVESSIISAKSLVDLDKFDGHTFATSSYADQIKQDYDNLKSALE